MKVNPYRFYLLVAAVLSAALGVVLWRYTAMRPLWSYVTAVSMLTFAFYGFDKRRAVRGGGRVPEAVLHLLALAGGSAGALAGQVVFRHKTQKLKFRAVFFAIVALQIGCVLWWALRARA